MTRASHHVSEARAFIAGVDVSQDVRRCAIHGIFLYLPTTNLPYIVCPDLRLEVFLASASLGKSYARVRSQPFGAGVFSLATRLGRSVSNSRGS